MNAFKSSLRLGLFLLLGLSACKEKENNTSLPPNVVQEVTTGPNAKGALQVSRFDLEFCRINRNNFGSEFRALAAKYPTQAAAFLYGFGIDMPITEATLVQLFSATLVHEKESQELCADIQGRFGAELGKIKLLDTASLMKAYAKINKILPGGSDTLHLYFANTFFTMLVSPFSDHADTIMISLEKFMGHDYKAYKLINEQFTGAISSFADVEFMQPMVLQSILGTRYAANQHPNRSFLEQAIYTGKLLYLCKAVAPDIADSLIMRLTGKQLEWNKENEKRIWQNVVGSKVLYDTKAANVDPYFTEALFTSADGIPRESSPRLGTWLGYQIVSSFMDRQKADIKTLLETKNAQKFLQMSGYKP